MLTIIVSPKTIPIYSACGEKFHTRVLLAEEDGVAVSFHDRVDYTHVSDIAMQVILSWRPSLVIHLKLTPRIKKATIDFLRDHHAKEHRHIDCHYFATTVWGMELEYGRPITETWDFWKKPLFPRVGDTLFFLGGSAQQHFLHAAVYIGWGLYLSVYGDGGDLEVSTLKDMERDYCSRRVVRVTPKKNVTATLG